MPHKYAQLYQMNRGVWRLARSIEDFIIDLLAFAKMVGAQRIIKKRSRKYSKSKLFTKRNSCPSRMFVSDCFENYFD